MTKRLVYFAVLSIAAIAAGGLVYTYGSTSSREASVADLLERTHIHGLAVDTKDPTRIFLATHHGLFIASHDGKTRRVSTTRNDFMGFTAHPADPSVLYASGHPEAGGNLGFIVSQDSGRSWNRRSNGINGPADFHQMDVSKADARFIYGAHGDLQRSVDGGLTWTRVGPVPDGLIAIAASSTDVNGIYAATQSGLFHSSDGGRTWTPIFGFRRVATNVHVTRDGSIYAFVVGLGLVRASESEMAWQLVSNSLGEDYLIYFASDPTDRKQLYAVTFNSRSKAQGVIESRDGGLRWTMLGSR